MSDFKCQSDLVKENPKGNDTLSNPHNFSSNPGFMSTAGMLGASAPGSVIRGTVARGSLPRPSSPVATPSRPVSNFNGR